MLRSTFALALVTSFIVLVVSETSLAKPLLAKSTAESTARQVLVTKAKDKGVTVKTADARAACTVHARFPNTYSCKLTERHKRCAGRTEIYIQGADKVPRARNTRVTCATKK